MLLNRGEYESINNLISKVFEARQFLEELSERDYAAKWDTRYINDLPNSAFAVIEKGYSEGKDRRARHLPHHSKEVKSATEDSSVDLPHFRNALARVNQIKSVFGVESDSTLRKRAARHLQVHMDLLNKEKSSFNQLDLVIFNECVDLFSSNVEPLLSDYIPEEE